MRDKVDLFSKFKISLIEKNKLISNSLTGPKRGINANSNKQYTNLK